MDEKPIWMQALSPALYVALIAAAVLFAHSGLHGDHGLAELRAATRIEAQLELDRAALEAERLEVANRVRRLDERHLDLDLLDERARLVLGLARTEELVLRPADEPPF